MNKEQKAAIEEHVKSLLSDPACMVNDYLILDKPLLIARLTGFVVMEYQRGYDDCYDEIRGGKV